MPDTWPSPVWPSDSAIEALDGTTHQASGLAFVAKGTGPTSSPSLEVQNNRMLERLFAELAQANELRCVDEGGVNVGVYPGNYTLGGTQKRFAGATTQALADNNTNYVWIDASNALQTNTTGFPADLDTFVPVAVVTTASGDITLIDNRLNHGRYIIGGAAATQGTNAQNFTIDQDNTGAGAAELALLLNRGTDGGDAGLKWNETADQFELYKDVDTPTRGELELAKLRIDSTGPVLRNDAGELEVMDDSETGYAPLACGNLTVSGSVTGIDVDELAEGTTYGRVAITDQLNAGVLIGTQNETFDIEGPAAHDYLRLKAGQSGSDLILELLDDAAAVVGLKCKNLYIGSTEIIDSTGKYASSSHPKVDIPDASGTSPVDTTLQVKDDLSNNVAATHYFVVSVHDSADLAPGFATNATISVQTYGTSLESLTAGKELLVKTDSSGRVGIRVTDGTAESVYLGVRPHRGSARFDCSDTATITIN